MVLKRQVYYGFTLKKKQLNFNTDITDNKKSQISQV